MLKNSKNLIFLKFQILIRDWNRSGNRPICGHKVGSVPKSFQNFFYAKRTQIDELISKKHTPPPKKGLFFWGGWGGGGSGDRWSLRTMCLGLIVKKKKNENKKKSFFGEKTKTKLKSSY